MIEDLNGRRVPRGRTVRTLDYPALTGTLPSWLSVPAGTGSFVDPVTALGHYRVSGTPTVRLQTLPVRATWPGVEWLAFTASGVHFNASSAINPGIALKSDAGDAGVGVFHVAGEGTCRLRLLGAGVPDVSINYVWSGDELLRRRNLTIAIGVRDSSVWLMEDDQVFHHDTYPNLVFGASLRGVLDAATTATREMRVLGVTFTTETN